ncbi:MAG: hypothetical protein GY898_33550 [Proteobacteria bacterium]|nr:hypothetical protein [Pseudomonadota bacterium]
MKPTLLPMLSLVFLLSTPAFAAQTLVIKSKPMKAGVKIVETETLAFELEVQVTGPETAPVSFRGTRTETTQRTEKVLAWDDDHRRLKVTFDEVTRLETARDPSGQVSEDAPTSPLTGNTYIVDWTRAGGLTVGAVDDGAVPEVQASDVRDHYADLGEAANDMAELLAGRKLVIGEAVDIPPDSLSTIIGGDEDFTVEEFSMVLLEKRKVMKRPCAVFAVELVMSQSDQDLRMVVRMAGEVALSLRDGWLVSLDVTGPLAADGKAPAEGLSLSGGGVMTGIVTYAYGK